MSSLVPAPRVLDHRPKRRARGHPAKLARGTHRAGDKPRAIARTARARDHRNLHAGDRLGGLDHVAHGKSVPGAEVEHARTAPFFEPAQPAQMRLDQVHHMHIIADAGAVRRVVIGAKDRQRVAPPGDGV
jgi:hypothetical protein